jgi:hypothetical protein
LAVWKEKLGTPGAVQMAHGRAMFEPQRWYELVPDQDNSAVIEGRGRIGEFE